MLENYKEVVEALEETNESVIAHRFNDILRVLTIFSIVFLPATLVASIWGMNVGLPGAGDPPTAAHTTFWILIAAMIGLIGGMLAWFRRRGWF
jgi:magnesium transporter